MGKAAELGTGPPVSRFCTSKLLPQARSNPVEDCCEELLPTTTVSNDYLRKKKIIIE